MKYKVLLSYTLAFALFGLSSAANAGFNFGSPFDGWTDNGNAPYGYQNYRGRGYNGNRWQRYSQWEPNYWRYRYMDRGRDDYAYRGSRERRYREDPRYRSGNDQSARHRYAPPDRYQRGTYRSRGNDRRDNAQDYRRMSETPELERQRAEQRARQPVECR